MPSRRSVEREGERGSAGGWEDFEREMFLFWQLKEGNRNNDTRS